MKIKKKLMLVITISFLCFGCDQGTKTLASNYLPRLEMDSYLNDFLRVGYTENMGAFLGIGSSLPSDYHFVAFFVVVSLILLALLLYIFYSGSLTSKSVVALSLLLSGGVSNLFDRFVNDGAVIDFLNIGVGTLRTGIFNLADIAIVTGAALLVVNSKNSSFE